MSTSESDWMTHPEPFSLGTEWLFIGIFSVLFLYLVMVVGMKIRPVWALVGVVLLPFTLLMLVCWSMLPVWLTRTILVAGVVDQALRRPPPARHSNWTGSNSTNYSRN